MPGLFDRMTFDQFAAAAKAGTLTPRLSVIGGGGSAIAPASGTSASLPPQVGKIVAQIMLSDVKSRFSTGTGPDGVAWRPLRHPRPNGGDKPLRDTGVLMASLHAGFDATSVWVATTHPGAALQNFGGTVRANGKMLAIPLTKEAKRSGGPRRWESTNGPLEFQPTRKKRVFLLMSEDAAGHKVGQFLLVDEVTVPARRFMGLSPRAEVQIGKVLLEAVARGWMSS